MGTIHIISTYSTVFMVGMDRTTILLQNVVASLGMVEIDTAQIYNNKYGNLRYLYKQSDAII